MLTDYHANGSYETLRKYVEILDTPDYAHMVRTTDFIRDDFEGNVKYVTQGAYEHLKKTQLFGGEIIINKIGTNSGQNFLMPDVMKPSTLGMNIFMLRLKTGFSSKTYQAFLSTGIGKILINQKINGAAPKSLDKDSVRDITVPIFSLNFQGVIDELIDRVTSLKKSSELKYAKAEKLLYEYVGIDFDELDGDSINQKMLSQSLQLFSRVDSEYYLPKYDDLVEKIKLNRYEKLIDLVSIKKSIEPGSSCYADEGVPFIRVSDYSKNGLTKPDKYLSDSFVNENIELIQSLYPKKETIFFSKDGTVGIAYKLEKDEEVITSGAVLHLSVTNQELILSDYLVLLLNSKIVKMQAERDAGGSIILHWLPKEIEQVLIPVIEPIFQAEISDLIKESFSLRNQSQKQLLSVKKSLEIATLQGEEIALRYLKNEANYDA